jgi:hypothetical protein
MPQQACRELEHYHCLWRWQSCYEVICRPAQMTAKISTLDSGPIYATDNVEKMWFVFASSILFFFSLEYGPAIKGYAFEQSLRHPGEEPFYSVH